MASGDLPNSVKEARERFDLFSDASLATRLQNEEFGAHFDANRQERRLVGSDTKVSRVEQMNEMQRQAALRREQLSRVAETDQEIARRLQEEFNREEEVKRFLAQKQAEDDERIARELQGQEQGRIVGYGPSSQSVPSRPTPTPPAPVTARRQSNPHHIYAAQNNLNEHYADRASTSLIDLSAEDALTTLPAPQPFPPSTNPASPFLTELENRVAAYAPSDAVPLLPPPPEFVVRREQERAMEELSRLQPRLAMAGLAVGDTVAWTAPGATVSPPPPAYVAPLLYSPPPPTAYAAPAIPPRPLPAAAPATAVTTQTSSGVRLADTNPFLIDLMGEETRESSVTTGGAGYFSEFGLPPPSSLATGEQRGNYSQSLI